MNFVLIGFCGVRQVAYYGRGDEVVEYFSDFGMHCSPHYNPADFIST